MTDPTFKTGLRYSLAIHAALLVLLCGGIKGCGRGKGDSDKPQTQTQGMSNPEHKDIVDKEVEVELKEMTPQQEAEEEALVKKPQYTKRECGESNWYGGIGIQVNLMRDGNYYVDHVYKGYPGDKAGMQDGDRLLNYSDYKGEPGTPVKIMYERAGESQPRVIDAVREKICILEGVLP